MDIIENIKSVLRAAADLGDKFDKFNVKSVARGANDQSFQFPCLIDDTVPVEFATTITKNLDRLYASWTQIYLSSIGFIDLNYIKNPKQFVAKYQPKFRLEDGDENDEISDFLEACDQELTDHLYGDDESLYVESFNDLTVCGYIGPAEKVPLSVQKQLKENMKPYMDGINVSGLRTSPIYEATDPTDVLSQLSKASDDRDAREVLKATRDARAPRIGEMEVKKINEMQPYPLELKLLASKGDSSFSEWINYTIGVKTYLHLAKTSVLEKNLVYVLQNKNPIFNFIRWTTGEISLFRDIILHMDDINFDIANKNDKTGKFISSLKKMRKKYLKVGTFGVNRMAPMATIVISSSTYQDVKNSYGYDLKNITFAKKIMEELFLMCFVIIDDVNHTVDLLVDGQQDFQTYSLDMLEREVTMNSNKLGKELTRMLGSNM